MSKNLFTKDPQETTLGRKIVRESISMINQLGFEAFTFKKLAKRIDSTEASVYRYFDNKHRILVYVIAWYWNWMEYKIDYEVHNISDPIEKLKIALRIITAETKQDPAFPEVDEVALHRIVLSESDKTYLTKQVDEDNREGLFMGFKSLCRKIAEFVDEINPEFEYSRSLISTALKASHQQLFYAEHLPSLTNLENGDVDIYKNNEQFLKTVVFNTIRLTH
ncbi:MAG: TetR/AcrR family transcriptional regulator [Cyclobacteriaceae bacterium]